MALSPTSYGGSSFGGDWPIPVSTNAAAGVAGLNLLAGSPRDFLAVSSNRHSSGRFRSRTGGLPHRTLMFALGYALWRRHLHSF